MNLKYFHDFEGNEDYPLPYVLVYRGRESELMDVSLHCKMFCHNEWTAGLMQQVDQRNWTQSFHFAKKSDAMFCKLKHDV
jgi:hypothetical protein